LSVPLSFPWRVLAIALINISGLQSRDLRFDPTLAYSIFRSDVTHFATRLSGSACSDLDDRPAHRPGDGSRHRRPSQPAKNGSVAAGDVTIEIEYSGRIDAPRSRLCLVPPDGGERELRLEDEGRPNVMKRKAANLFPGVYILRWYVLSSDGPSHAAPFHFA
jgi:CopC domain